MTKQDISKSESDEKAAPTGLDLLREPFPANQISKLPKPTKKQTDDFKGAMAKKDYSLGIRCKLCGGWHHKDVVHLDYVGHAALTDRLLDADPSWNWEPVAVTEKGTPETDENGGMWIRLTVCGVTRLGYGHPDGKHGGDAIKELIGDALRNAAMRFGAALDLWHKGDLHGDEEPVQPENKPDPQAEYEAHVAKTIKDIKRETDMESLGAFWSNFAKQHKTVAKDQRVIDAKNARKEELKPKPADDLGGDDIPF